MIEDVELFICTKCENTFPSSHFRYGKKNTQCRGCRTHTERKKRTTRSVYWVNTRSRECECCQERLPVCAYDWHHIEPGEKDHAPGSVFSLKFETQKSELKKCRLLCSNCHRIIHALWNMGMTMFKDEDDKVYVSRDQAIDMMISTEDNLI